MSATPATFTRPIDKVLSRLGPGVKRSGDDYSAHCPAHDDQKPSLSVKETPDRVLLHCHRGCTPEAIAAAIGLEMLDLFVELEQQRKAEIVTVYPYTDEQGELLYQTVRLDPKDFRQRQPDPKNPGKWIWNLKGTRRTLYRLPELLAADSNEHVLIAEGEKDVEALRALGFVATTNAMGAGKWRDDYSDQLRGRQVVILPDNDEVGADHARQIAQSLAGKAASVRIVELPRLGPRKPNHGRDVSNWLADAGGTADELRELIEKTPPIATEARKPKVEIQSAAQLLSQTFPEPRWIVPNIVAEGLTIVAGRPKLGKSRLALSMAVAVATGGYTLGTVKVEQGQTLYVDMENGPRRLQSRIQALLKDEPAPERLDTATEWPRLDDGGLEELENYLTAHPDTRLVVLDTLKRVRGQEKAGTSWYAQDYDCLSPLADLAHRFNVGIIVVHHTNKREAEDPLDLVSGTTGLTGAVDAAIVLKRDRGKADAVLAVVGRDIEDAELALRMDTTIGSWVLLGDAAAFRLSNEKGEILEALQAAGGALSPKQIAEIVDRPPVNVRQLLGKMLKAGQVKITTYGKYIIDRDHTDHSDHSGHTDHSDHSSQIIPFQGRSNGSGGSVIGDPSVTSVIGVIDPSDHTEEVLKLSAKLGYPHLLLKPPDAILPGRTNWEEWLSTDPPPEVLAEALRRLLVIAPFYVVDGDT